jgi:hypothetical protein
MTTLVETSLDAARLGACVTYRRKRPIGNRPQAASLHHEEQKALVIVVDGLVKGC